MQYDVPYSQEPPASCGGVNESAGGADPAYRSFAERDGNDGRLLPSAAKPNGALLFIT